MACSQPNREEANGERCRISSPLFEPGGYDIRLARPVDALARTRVPVLLVHGEADRVVPVGTALELATAGGGHQLEVFPGAGRCCAVFADPERHWGCVLGFLGRWV